MSLRSALVCHSAITQLPFAEKSIFPVTAYQDLSPIPGNLPLESHQ